MHSSDMSLIHTNFPWVSSLSYAVHDMVWLQLYGLHVDSFISWVKMWQNILMDFLFIYI